MRRAISPRRRSMFSDSLAPSFLELTMPTVSDLEFRTGITAEYGAAFGHFMIAFSSMEDIMNQLIWKFLNIDGDDGEAITGLILNFNVRRNMFETLSSQKLYDRNLRHDATKINSSLEKLNRHRNNMVHGSFRTWTPTAEEMTFLRVKIEGKVIYKEHAYTKGYILERIGDIHSVILALQTLYINYEYGVQRVQPPPLSVPPPQ